jgi:hypothetical protein
MRTVDIAQLPEPLTKSNVMSAVVVKIPKPQLLFEALILFNQ